MSLGQRIRKLRMKKGMTQYDIAQILGMGRSNFGHIENNRVIPSSDDIDKIADILGTTTDYLLGREDSVDSNDETPYWMTSKNAPDIKRMLNEENEVLFDGVPMTAEDKEKVKQVLDVLFWDAKKNK